MMPNSMDPTRQGESRSRGSLLIKEFYFLALRSVAKTTTTIKGEWHILLLYIETHAYQKPHSNINWGSNLSFIYFFFWHFFLWIGLLWCGVDWFLKNCLVGNCIFFFATVVLSNIFFIVFFLSNGYFSLVTKVWQQNSFKIYASENNLTFITSFNNYHSLIFWNYSVLREIKKKEG